MSSTDEQSQSSDCTQLSITELPINHAELTDSVRDNACGSVVLFLGTVREITAGKKTSSLEYEAYYEMAISELHRLVDTARLKWPIKKISIIHRTGHLDLGEIAVGIALSTPHRKEGFEAAQFLMSQIKETVPIWKKENWADGSTDWVHPES
ncbi:MAG: molybdenum cofactor biosynthesis protein MoaE [Planctomycetaceae bacterium]|nr:molybdenum cofactor biosynthesis protein MoaE [Planctomycetaceae bacterium]